MVSSAHVSAMSVRGNFAGKRVCLLLTIKENALIFAKVKLFFPQVVILSHVFYTFTLKKLSCGNYFRSENALLKSDPLLPN